MFPRRQHIFNRTFLWPRFIAYIVTQVTLQCKNIKYQNISVNVMLNYPHCFIVMGHSHKHSSKILPKLLSLWVITFALEYVNSMAQENQKGLKVKVINHLLVERFQVTKQNLKYHNKLNRNCLRNFSSRKCFLWFNSKPLFFPSPTKNLKINISKSII